MSEELDTQDGPNKKKWIIIGVAVVAVIAVIIFATTYGLTPSGAEEPTAVQVLQEKVGNLETWKAETAEDISDINSSLNALEAEIDGLVTPYDWSNTIDDIQSQLDALEESVSNLTFQDVAVTRIEGEYVDVTVYQTGKYPVVLNLYGEGITNIEARYPTIYTIAGTWGSNSTMVAVISPQGEWTADYKIELKATGTVDYACALIGKAEGVTEEGW